MRGLSAIADFATADEARSFAATVAGIVARHAPEDPWTPGAAVSDADPALDRALKEAGWEELGEDERLLPLAAPAAAELGRAFASLVPIDRLLGGALVVGNLARHAHGVGATAAGGDAPLLVEPLAGRLVVARATELEPVRYTDALGVARVAVERGRVLPEQESRRRMNAWVAASTGYLAGMTAEGLRIALDHARSRRAFGGPLSALEPVQQLLADSATLADGLELLAAGSPGLDALAHAGDAAARALAGCMQVTGALGFTMEFPLQCAYRRARSARAFAERVIAAWDAPA